MDEGQRIAGIFMSTTLGTSEATAGPPQGLPWCGAFPRPVEGCCALIADTRGSFRQNQNRAWQIENYLGDYSLMRLDTIISQEMRQQMVLAPRMIQSMEILQLPIMALEKRIQQELQENPVLELKEVTSDDLIDD